MHVIPTGVEFPWSQTDSQWNWNDKQKDQKTEQEAIDETVAKCK